MLVIKLWGEWAKFCRTTEKWTCRDAKVLSFLEMITLLELAHREFPYSWEIDWELEEALLDELSGSGGEEGPPFAEVIAWIFGPLTEVEHCWLTPHERYGWDSHERPITR